MSSKVAFGFRVAELKLGPTCEGAELKLGPTYEGAVDRRGDLRGERERVAAGSAIDARETAAANRRDEIGQLGVQRLRTRDGDRPAFDRGAIARARAQTPDFQLLRAAVDRHVHVGLEEPRLPHL